MTFELHHDFRLQKLKVGHEQAPLIVIDNLVADPDELVNLAAGKLFGDVVSYYPGVRAKVPLTYQRFVIEQLRGVFAECFGLAAGTVRFTACHFSLVTTPPEKLTYLQRIPHVDSLSRTELAFVHYLFKAPLGGTAFYRHRSTGFESLDPARRPLYWRHIEEEQNGAAPSGCRVHQRRYAAVRADWSPGGALQPHGGVSALFAALRSPGAQFCAGPGSPLRKALGQRFSRLMRPFVGVSPAAMLHLGTKGCCFFSVSACTQAGVRMSQSVLNCLLRT